MYSKRIYLGYKGICWKNRDHQWS
nr:unnamed protein product [Callosobruchus chinensis]